MTKSVRIVTLGLAFLSVAPGAFATVPVPEIDGGSASLALGLAVSAIALVRDRLRRR